ncbi:hypothetical protein [Actinoplanes auranticolor]|uniref:Uncharacterized protein n=1 Tax=Actinoplanes auranticolor TaxID=47988 RepID=A0A919VPL3_9ACTN|nr:hypothetical protein [Actinoplanes auranticolor]GIM73974.1 hypothetical protein Aau02nite_58550 [Actinoplanes auranticolor]
MLTPPLFAALAPARNVLIAGAGGGLDAAVKLVTWPTIVHGQIAAATRGAFGDVQFTRRTSGSTLFVNPLTAMYFTVDLDKLAARCLYIDRIENAWGRRQVTGRIEAFRSEISPRIPRVFPQ